MNPANAKTRLHKTKLEKEKAKFEEGIRKAARAEILNAEGAGYVKIDEDEEASHKYLTQHEICEAVDMASASKVRTRMPIT